MNPGLFVLGGGGAGGGSGAGGGKGKGGKQGANGKNGGKDAKGGGKGACGQGPGSDGGACPNNHGGSMGAKGGASQGDPVDMVSGEVFTYPVADVSLPGPLPLAIVRSYRTGSIERDVGLGWGWTHSLSWRIEQRRRSVIVHTFDGLEVSFGKVPDDTAILGPHGWLLHREGDGFLLEITDGTRYHFEPDVSEPGAGSYRLLAIRDRSDNRIALSYDSGLLTRVTDSVGRVVTVRRTTTGHIAAYETLLRGGEPFVFARFRHDSEGNLVEAWDAEGHSMSFAYGPDHRITEKRHPTGLRFHYRHDAAGRCVETWGDYGDAPDPCLSSDAPELLGDGKTRAKGIHHVLLEYGPDGYTEAVDATTIHATSGNAFGKVDKAVCAGKVFTRRYDAHGHLIEFIDPTGAVTRWERDFYGNETKVTDPLGHTTVLERDAAGDLLRIVDPEGGETTVERTARMHRWVDPIGAVFEVRYDARGLTEEVIAPTGHRRRYVHDAHGNLVEVHGALGGRWTATYDELGRRRSFTSADGATTRLHHDRRGLLVCVEEPHGGVLRYGYDGEGMLVSITDADGGVTRLVRGGTGVLADAHRPDGTVIRFRYDRMERLVSVTNGNGETHSFELNAFGVVCGEKTFDGRLIRYKHDELGRVIQIRGDAETVDLERDAAGRVIKKIFEDDHEESFEYNARGELVRAEGPNGEVRFERNAVGWITREIQTTFGRTYWTAKEYDLLGNPRRKTTSTGRVIEQTYDDAAHKLVTRLDGASVTSFYDVAGREIRTVLPGGGTVDAQYDFEGRVLARQALGRSAPAGASQPEWLGRAPMGAVVEQRYSFTPSGSLATTFDARYGAVELRHDPLGQLTGIHAGTAAGLARQFGYDASGSRFETTPGATTAHYGPGGQLQHMGNIELRWDERGCLVERLQRTSADETLVTRFHTGASGLLETVDLPDGRRLENAYDPFARRVRKVVTRGSGASREVLSTTHFFWDGMTLATEVHVDASRAERTRTYCFDAEGMPWAHKSHHETDGVPTEEPWRYYLNDPLTGYPERLLDDTGAVVSEMRHTPWGRLERAGDEPPTPLRFAGQYEDQETGLFYNRHRFYDPDLGLYLTPDPLGLEGGLSPYAYAANQPDLFFDVDGLIFSQIVDPGPPEKVLHTGKNPGEGGTKTPPPWLSDKPCAEAQALTDMADKHREQIKKEQQKVPKEKRLEGDALEAETKKRVQQEFKDKNLKIETFDQQDPRRRQRVDPCAKCGKMFENLGITGNVVGAKGKVGKYGVYGK